MRILTWNINGIKTIPQYHPWNTFKDHDEILNKLKADIICFQEIKSSRSILPRDVAIPSSYDSFFSFPAKKSGYSGVGIYTRRSIVTPVKAEEGLTGLIQLKPPFTLEERVSEFQNYPPQLIDDDDDLDFKHLDSEGRAVVVDCGLFVLINVYCPNDGTGTDERDKFKMDFHKLLSKRVEGLQKEGREVIVLGDINACAAVIDHCEGNILVARGKAAGMEGEEGFWEKEFRVWLRDWLQKEDGTGGPLVDIVRRFWPGRKGMYTCWNTKISARETNYGTRIDYILITPGLVPWVKAANVQQDVKGSDHCPVFVDLCDEIISDQGTVIKLEDVIGAKPNPDGKKEPPRLATKFWEEHSGKQTSLDSFFGKHKKLSVHTAPPSLTPQPPDAPLGSPMHPNELTGLPSPETPPLSLEFPPSSPYPATSLPVAAASQPLKRKVETSAQSISKKSKPMEKTAAKRGKVNPGQAKLSSFLTKRCASHSPSSSTLSPNGNKKPPQITDMVDMVDVDAYVEELPSLEVNEAPCQRFPAARANGTQVKQVWENLLAPVQPPNCVVHGEPAKGYTVKKPGPNKGKRFYLCSRPVGPGWDKGKADRLRQEVDSTYRCNFFKWSSDWRKQARKAEATSSSLERT